MAKNSCFTLLTDILQAAIEMIGTIRGHRKGLYFAGFIYAGENPNGILPRCALSLELQVVDS